MKLPEPRLQCTPWANEWLVTLTVSLPCGTDVEGMGKDKTEATARERAEVQLAQVIESHARHDCLRCASVWKARKRKGAKK